MLTIPFLYPYLNFFSVWNNENIRNSILIMEMRAFFNISKILQPLHGSVRTLMNSGKSWRMDIHFIVDSYSHRNVALNSVCVTPA